MKIIFPYITTTSSYDSHTYLLSFPTRRSSDLLGLGERPVGHRHLAVGQADPRPGRAGQQPGGVEHHARSEEHTSELQSHSDLVCRLLLEKKKSGKAS